MGKWTPGPWVARTRHANMIDVTHNVQTLGAITHALCRAQARATWVEEATANASLIAAAPEMAEALADLIEVVDYIERTYGSRINPPTLNKARAILARINGNAP